MNDIVVVGSINLDLIMRVESLPKPGETAIGGSLVRLPGGKGANQSAAAARLGAATWLIGMTGDDEAGREMREELARDGVDVRFVGIGDGGTGAALIFVGPDGENLIAVASGANLELSPSFVETAFERLTARDAVVLAGLEVPDDAVIAAAGAARERGWRFILNPAPARALRRELVALCDVITPNEHEAEVLGSLEDLLDAGAGAVVVTRSARGAEVLRAGVPPIVQEPFPVTVVDSTGAGDAFNAALAWAIAGGAELEEAVRLASAAGALSTRAIGARAGLPSADEVETFAGPLAPARGVALTGTAGEER